MREPASESSMVDDPEDEIAFRRKHASLIGLHVRSIIMPAYVNAYYLFLMN